MYNLFSFILNWHHLSKGCLENVIYLSFPHATKLNYPCTSPTRAMIYRKSTLAQCSSHSWYSANQKMSLAKTQNQDKEITSLYHLESKKVTVSLNNFNQFLYGTVMFVYQHRHIKLKTMTVFNIQQGLQHQFQPKAWFTVVENASFLVHCFKQADSSFIYIIHHTTALCTVFDATERQK